LMQENWRWPDQLSVQAWEVPFCCRPSSRARTNPAPCAQRTFLVAFWRWVAGPKVGCSDLRHLATLILWTAFVQYLGFLCFVFTVPWSPSEPFLDFASPKLQVLSRTCNDSRTPPCYPSVSVSSVHWRRRVPTAYPREETRVLWVFVQLPNPDSHYF